jgi:hypothetical protein
VNYDITAVVVAALTVACLVAIYALIIPMRPQ